MLEALRNTLGIVTPALEIARVSRYSYYQWLKDDPDFAREVSELNDVRLDFGETQLIKRMRDEDTTAIIFYLKTKGKHRGYIEKVEQQLSGEITVKKRLLDE